MSTHDYWAELGVGTKCAIFVTGLGSAALQVAFLFMLMMELPGWSDADTGRVRFISDQLAQHQGIGMALICFFLPSLCVLCCITVNFPPGPNRNLLQHMYFFLAALPISSGFCVVLFTNEGPHQHEHLVATCILFVSFAAVHLIALFTVHTNKHIVDFVLIVSTFLSSILFVVFYAIAAGEHSVDKYSLSAVFEFIAVLMFVVLNIQAPFRVRSHTRRVRTAP
jgi:hypothetical protein